MGCSATKNLTVEPLGDLANGHAEIRTVPVSANLSNIPPLEAEDIQEEILDSPSVNNIQKAPDGMAFDIAFQDEPDESIIRKHPPKRFQKLVEQPSSPVTLNKLQEKLEEAEIRRQQILAQRIQSAKYRNQLKKQSSSSSIIPDPSLLQLPTDDPSPTPKLQL